MFDELYEEEKEDSINMTPVIDVVFLLIIFFMLVCQFITAENFDVSVPDNISLAAVRSGDEQLITVTVMLDENSQVRYAVGGGVLSAEGSQAVSEIASMLAEALADLPPAQRIVCLRADKDITFADAKYALMGISQSHATKVHWAVTKTTSEGIAPDVPPAVKK